MSTANKPLGMNSMPASGYNHKSTTYNKQYVTWKGSGINSNPIGSASGHIRPLTNNDPGNVFQTGFGLPRPIKHFRKGRVIPSQPVTGINDLNVNSPYNDVNLTINEQGLINYNMNRFVSSSKGTSLGGGFGGSGLLNDLQDKPGAFIVKQNPLNEVDGVSQMNTDCKTCEGVGIVTNYYPNKGYLTENPEPNTTNPVLCCNEEYKAKRRAIYASTNLKKNYYTSTKQYLQNRCKTYDQKAFNFLSYRTNTTGQYNDNNPYYAVSQLGPKAGSPETQTAAFLASSAYFANCQPNSQIYDATQSALIEQMITIMVNTGILTQTDVAYFTTLKINSIDGFFNWLNTYDQLTAEQRIQLIQIYTDFISNPYSGMPLSGPSNPAGCQLTVYKPNNYQYAKQGAVSSSTRNLKLNVDTISTNAASINNYNNTGPQLVSANQLYVGDNPNVINLLKNKAPGCNTPWPLNLSQSGPFQNKKICRYKTLPQYQNPVSQQSPYRYFPGTVFSSNHFSQSPNTYNTTSGGI